MKLHDALADFGLCFSRSEDVSDGLLSLRMNHLPCAAHLAETGQEHTTDSLVSVAAVRVPCETLDVLEDLDSEGPTHSSHS